MKGTDEVSDGSPLIALKAGPPRFTHLYWVEAKRRSATSLRAHRREHPHREITVLQGNANERVDDVLKTLPREAPAFAFLDPYASELDWETVVKLARHKAPGYPKIELFILFAVDTAFLRLMPRESTKMMYEAILDRVMPDQGG
ncbi:MAG: three-Cys-motif partner protein TcmP [Chloroflexota bacterium]|nr:three-Cys-motif partner protein TcmP [Chloroflexota bacterium]